jgi:hypothetical protein
MTAHLACQITSNLPHSCPITLPAAVFPKAGLVILVLLSLQFAGRDTPSTVISFAQKALKEGQVVSKLHVIELGSVPGAQGAFNAVQQLGVGH